MESICLSLLSTNTDTEGEVEGNETDQGILNDQ